MALRDKTIFKSELDNIKGIGEKRKVSLLKHFGSVEVIKSKTADELATAPAMNRLAAELVYNYFRGIK